MYMEEAWGIHNVSAKHRVALITVMLHPDGQVCDQVCDQVGVVAGGSAGGCGGDAGAASRMYWCLL